MMGSSAGFQGAGSENGTDITRLSRIWTSQTDAAEAEMDQDCEDRFDI